MVNKERVGALIEKLQTQHQQNAPAHYLIITVHQLQAALLQQALSAEHLPTNSQPHTDVAPATAIALPVQPPTTPQQNTNAPIKISFELQQPASNINNPIPLQNTQAININNSSKIPVSNAVVLPSHVELNEALANNNQSLNDKLTNTTTELAQLLNTTPIADLRKAFSINEKFIIVQTLFKNNANMYDSCLKTLNNFSTHNEAMYWMEREFITNLAWNKDDEIVKNFYNKVQRKFL